MSTMKSRWTLNTLAVVDEGAGGQEGSKGLPSGYAYGQPAADGLVQLREIMWPFKKTTEKKKAEPTSRLVENPGLEAAMFRHHFSPTEQTVTDVGRALQAATYLAPILGDRLKLAEHGQTTVIQPGSVIEFMTCQSSEGKTFLPVFTSWSELRLWAGNDAQAFVLGASEVWSRVLNEPRYGGAVINPANMPWTLEPEHIKMLIAETR